MRKLKKYNLFLEELITDPNRLIGLDMQKHLESIELYHVGDHIWAVKIADSHSRAMLFLRSQEYYESIFEEIINKQFKFSRFQDLYKQHYGKKEFTYGADWSGFNIPSTILEECMFNVPEEEMNTYDKKMLSIIYTIKEREGNSKYYLLGVDELANDLLEHEFAHAMWFTCPEYKKMMADINLELDSDIKDMMCKCIIEYGYADHVLADELQAYTATGLGAKMKQMNLPRIEEWMQDYREVFERFYSRYLYENPELLPIKWQI